jgi:hypothetical protein
MGPLRTPSIASLLALLLTACGGNGGSGGGGDGGVGDRCDHASDCNGNLVCNPSSGTCEADVPCSNHDQCGAGGHCSAAGTCASSTTGSPCDDDIDCRQGHECLEGFCGCEGVRFQGDLVPPNMLISLDRSGSMTSNNVPGTSPTKNRWTVAKEAVAAVLDEHGDEIRFGLKLWPGSNLACNQGGSCSPGAIFVDPDDGTASDINSVLAGASTCSYGTPITGSLDSLLDDDRLMDAGRANYVILITDGQQQNCSGDPVAAVTALRNQTPSVRTFVVGFSGDVDAQQLSDMAEAGGTARPGTPSYYQADDDAALAAAFDAIAGSVLSCSYVLDGTPPSDDLYVYFGTDPVDRDGANGWDYDMGSNTITFHGAACAALQAGEVTDLSIIYGCPSGPVD